MESQLLSYEPYNKSKLAIRGDQQYDSIIKTLGGRWNSRMKGGPGWLIDNNKEDQLKILINNVNSTFSPNNNNDESEDDEEEDNRIVSGGGDDDEPSQDSRELPQDSRSSRGFRDPREPREFREPRDFREPREPRDFRDHMEFREPREFRDPREPREFRDPREPREPREFRKYDNRETSRRNEYRREYDNSNMNHRDQFEKKLVDRYSLGDEVDQYYSRFTENTRLKKKNNRQARRELSDSESDSDYDSDELESLTHTLSRLHKKVESLKNKSRGRKHKRRDRY